VPFKDLTPKQRRTVDSDVKTLITIRGILTGKTIAQLRALSFFHPWLEAKKGSFPLSDAGVAALKCIHELFAKLSTTMNTHGNAQLNSKRTANTKVVHRPSRRSDLMRRAEQSRNPMTRHNFSIRRRPCNGLCAQ